MDTVWQSIADFISVNGLKILSLILTVVIGIIIIKVILKSLKKIFIKKNVDAIVVNFIVSIVYVILVVILVVAVFDILQVSTAPFVTVLGTAGLALALSLQDSLSNVASGLILIITKPFKQGDYVSIGEIEGSVRELKLLTTVLFTFDNKKVILPNIKVAKSEITNFSALPKRRLDLKYSVPYGTPVDNVKEVIGNVISAQKGILCDPPPQVRLSEHGASSVQFAARLWVYTQDYWNILFDLQENIYSALQKAGIKAPYSKMDVNLINKNDV